MALASARGKLIGVIGDEVTFNFYKTLTIEKTFTVLLPLWNIRLEIMLKN